MQCTLQVVCLSDDDQASRSNIAERYGLRQVRHSIVQAYPSFLAAIARSNNQKAQPWWQCASTVCGTAKSHEVHHC